MTIFRQLAIYFTLMLLLIFAGSLTLSVRDARNLQQTQLHTHAQDTATSLSVAIATTDPTNIAVVSSMIDAVFDRGYFQRIRFTNNAGEILVSREDKAEPEGVSDWFIGLVNVNVPEVTTEINNGLMSVGTLRLSSHPGHTYRSLWAITKALVILYLAGLLAVILGLAKLLNTILRPLKQTQKQADGISRRQFDIQESLPKTQDMHQLVEAMNRMTQELERQFTEHALLTEELRKQSVKDPLTGILNRQAFENRMRSALDQEQGEAGGSLLVIHVKQLDRLNLKQGHQTTDSLLVDISNLIGKNISQWPQAFLGRRYGSEFNVFIPACGIEENERIAEKIFRELSFINYFSSQEGSNLLHLASVTHMGRCQPEELFDHADQLLRNTQLQVGNNWKTKDVTQEQNRSYMHWSEKKWLDELTAVLAKNKVELFAQQAFDAEQKPVFKEVYTQLPLDGALASAAAFLPMVERFELHTELDQSALEVLLKHMEHTGADDIYCLNIAPHSLLDETFHLWLLNLLQNRTDIAKRLILETSERAVLLIGEKLSDRVKALTDTGCRFSIDQFGVASQTLSSLHMLDLHYVKVDSSFVQDVVTNKGNQLYLRTLSLLADARNIKLYAQGIETPEQWQMLQQIGIRGGQGYYLDRPAKL